MTDTRYTDDLNARFDQVLAGLNVAQHEAVGNIEGPMMVVAGPGTGKTHILAARIGCILRETDTLPHNILCLTFTEAAATAMKQRLLRFIGPDAYKVHIFTFHAFCNKVIQDHRAHFPAAMAEPAGDLLRLEVLRDVLDGLPPDNPLKQDYRNPYGRESAVRSLLNVMKTEHWTTENIRQAVDEYVLGLPYRDEYLYKMSVARYGFERGDLKQNRYDQEVQRMSQVAAAADLYDAYEQTMRHAGAYDFNDMLLWVLEAFRSKEWMLRNYQEQYLYMLVDEFQDTNGAQNELIRLLADYWEAPNLFVVGDDDQAIYEFQGARLRNLLDLQTAYEANMRLVILTDNYRSTQPILDAARQVIEANGLRLVNMLPNLEKVLTAHSTVSPALPVLTTYATRTQERDAVLEHIQQLLSSGVAATDIAVIVRRHAQYSELQALLERQGIRCAAARPAEVWKHPVGQQLRVLLTYLAAETWLPFSGEAALFDLLHHRYWGIAPIDIARISLAIREDKHGVKWRSFVADTDRLVAAGVSDIETVRRTSDILEGLIQHIENIPLEAAIERVIHESGLLRHAYDLPDRIEAVQILYTFFEFVQAECIRNPRLKIANIVDTFRKMDENRLALRTNTAHLPADGVQLLTAHASKGLEFEYVFVIDVVDTEWGRDNGASKSFKLPDTLTLSNVEEDAEESRRRLFYVAMTRARKGLYLSHSRTDDKGKVLSPSGFLHQLLDSAIPLVEQVEPTPDTSKIIDSLQLRLQVSPQLSPTEPALVGQLLREFKMSVSALNAYLYCPLQFYFKFVLRAPDTAGGAAAYGTAMHHALHLLYENMSRHIDKTYPDQIKFMQFFERELARHQHLFTPAAYELRLANGRKYLTQYYTEILPKTGKDVLLEYPIRNVVLEGVPLTGFLDKLEIVADDPDAPFSSRNIVITDYKTGYGIREKLARPSEKAPIGGDYWRQLVFYKILYELDSRHTLPVQDAVIQCLEPDEKGRLATLRADLRTGDVHLLTKLITETYKNIMEYNFYSGCGRPECHWCQFVTTRTAMPIHPNTDIAALDD